MPYKGGDLNLRLAGPAAPREASAITARSFDAPWRRPEGPIAVDEAVLACCNCAYDVALFHGSGEVRLEHLLHALTRVAAATQALAGLGIRTDTLRRETAVAIAVDVPAGPIGSEGQPQASAALQDALRRGAAYAEERLQPISINDLLRALLSGGPQSPAAALLMGAAVDLQRLERWRDAPRREAPLSVQPAEPAQARAADFGVAARDALAERLDRMEASFRAVREEAIADRRLTAELLGAVQGELQSLKADGPRVLPADLSEAITAVLETKLGRFDAAITALSDRLGALDTPDADEGWQALDARLAAIEAAIEDRLTAPAPEPTSALSNMLAARFKDTEARLQPLAAGIERQAALVAQMRADLGAAQEAAKASDRRLVEILQVLANLGAGQQTLGHSLAAWRVESGGDLSIVSNKVEQLLELGNRVDVEVQALRYEQIENAARRGNGFKRWLYGTGNVSPPSWRPERKS